jgi:hypothetical protein
MKQATRKTYQKDLIAQCTFPVMMLFYCIGITMYLFSQNLSFASRFLMLSVVFQTITIATQFLSASLHFLWFKSKSHLKYIIFIIFYSCFLFLSIKAGINSFWGNFYIFLFIFFVPSCSASWYYYYSLHHFRTLQKKPEDIPHYFKEDILDDGMPDS